MLSNLHGSARSSCTARAKGKVWQGHFAQQSAPTCLKSSSAVGRWLGIPLPWPSGPESPAGSRSCRRVLPWGTTAADCPLLYNSRGLSACVLG